MLYKDFWRLENREITVGAQKGGDVFSSQRIKSKKDALESWWQLEVEGVTDCLPHCSTSLSFHPHTITEHQKNFLKILLEMEKVSKIAKKS